ncbi:hypothetical protein D1BOALGB6SA_5537 [Olavius sp. associated proteobacterium Delta 1]|nr:hypothetical protein D1BOALGB6SA_5537 [Olavius sp. associated proteobacterium Delta 1]
MKNYPATGASIFSCLLLFISLISCSPKCVVRGRVVDAETRQPIQGAAVAIRWYTNDTAKQSAETGTIDAVQSVTGDRGDFKIPKYPDRQHILGVYKSGYICWSSQDIFTIDPGVSRMDEYRQRKNHRIKEGMEIELEQLQKSHPRDLHAGFAVMVAGESTDSDLGPFHQAIQTEYQLWRENLRNDFQQQVGTK